MLNRIWFWLLLIGIVYGPAKGLVQQGIYSFFPAAAEVIEMEEAPPSFAEQGKRVTTAAVDGADAAVGICMGLIGIMVLWLGLLQVAKDAGLVDGLAWLLRPLMRWLFPDIPDGHPAQGAILMNMSANMLGLDNAATPFGLQAMKELDDLNTQKGTATNAMATFLTINTSSVTLVPIAIIGLRVANGSEDPAAPLFGIILATLVSTIVGVTAVRLLERLPAFAITEEEVPVTEGEGV